MNTALAVHEPTTLEEMKARYLDRQRRYARDAAEAQRQIQLAAVTEAAKARDIAASAHRPIKWVGFGQGRTPRNLRRVSTGRPRKLLSAASHELAMAIKREVAHEAMLDAYDLDTRRKSLRFTIPRRRAMWWIYKEVDITMTQLGRLFGCRCMSTVKDCLQKYSADLAAGRVEGRPNIAAIKAALAR